MISRETGEGTGTGTGLQGDFGLLSPESASPFVAALTGDRAVLAAVLRVEAAWAAVLEQAAQAPAGTAARSRLPFRPGAAAAAGRAAAGPPPMIFPDTVR